MISSPATNELPRHLSRHLLGLLIALALLATGCGGVLDRENAEADVTIANAAADAAAAEDDQRSLDEEADADVSIDTGGGTSVSIGDDSPAEAPLPTPAPTELPVPTQAPVPTQPPVPTPAPTELPVPTQPPVQAFESGWGVDAENKVIRLGLNANLSGAGAADVSEHVEAQKIYWQAFNEAGGYDGWTVQTVILDNGRQVPVGQHNYQTLAQNADAGALLITENSSHPITAAVANAAAVDEMVVLAGSRSSLWPDPVFGRPILEIGATYCAEAMNGVEWLQGHVTSLGQEPRLAIISRPGEYGDDGAAGARIAAEALGVPIVYDGTGAVTGEDRSTAVSGLVNSGATMVWAALTPSELLEVFEGAVAQGVVASWSANQPSFDSRWHLTTDVATSFETHFFPSRSTAPWGTPGQGNEWMQLELATRRPDLNLSDEFAVGWTQAMVAETLLRDSLDLGVATREAMLGVATTSAEADFLGLAENQAWPPDYNKAAVRSTWISSIDLSQRNLIRMGDTTTDSPSSTGLIAVDGTAYQGEVLAGYRFTGPCI